MSEIVMKTIESTIDHGDWSYIVRVYFNDAEDIEVEFKYCEEGKSVKTFSIPNYEGDAELILTEALKLMKQIKE